MSENSSLSKNLTQSSALAQNQTSSQLQNTSSPNPLAISALLKDKTSAEESLESPNVSPLSPFHLSEEEVTSQHKLHLVNSDKSSKMQGNFSPNAASVTLSGPGTLDLTSTGQSFTQDVTVDPQQADSENAADYPWTCCKKQPRPEGCKKCPDMPKAPPCKWSHVHLLAYIRMIKASVRWKREIYNLSCKILLCSLSVEENTSIISRQNLQFLDHSKK